MVVSHGLTISFLLSLIDASLPMQMALENGSVTTLTYEKGTFTIQGINDISYIEKGKRSLKSAVCCKRRLSVKMTDNLLFIYSLNVLRFS